MILKKIKLKNIRSYSDAEIHFPEGAILLTGDIGSGKTTILLAIEYALFGLQPGQRGSSILANGEDFGEVSLDFKVNGDDIVIERGLKRSSKSINQDFAAVTVNGSRFESSVTEVKTKILEILNYPQEFLRKNNLLYRYTVYTPQEEMKQIILEDSEARLDVLRHVFGIDKYKRIKENLQRLTAKLRDDARALQIETANIDVKKGQKEDNIKFTKILEGKIETKNKELLEIINSKKKNESELENLSKLMGERENFMKEIEKSTVLVMAKKQQAGQINKEIEDLISLINSNRPTLDLSRLPEIENLIKITTKTVDLLSTAFIDNSSKIKSLDSIRKKETENMARVFKIDFCPTCLQNVPEVHKHNILNAKENEIKRIEEDYKSAEQELKRIETEQLKQKQVLRSLESERNALHLQKARQENLDGYKERHSELSKSKTSLEKDIDLIERHINSLKEHALDYTKFENINKLKKEEMRKIADLEKSCEIEIAELKKEHELTIRDINRLQIEIDKVEVLRRDLIRILEYETWLSENFMNMITFTEKNILVALRKEFTKIFNKWFGMLTTDSFEVYLDETFSPVIVHSEFELDYAFLSGGERTAVALAYRLALNQLINSLLSKIKTQDLVILDEPTDGFSEQQLDKVRDILNELHVKQLLIVSHEQKIESFVDHIIRLKKSSSKSAIVNEVTK